MQFLKKIKKKINSKVYNHKGSKYFRLKNFSILIGCLFITFFVSNHVQALTLGKSLFYPSSGGINSGLIGYWTLDGNNLINNVTDSSGNGNNGILVNFPATSTVVVPGKVGQSLTFNNNYVSINDSASLRPSNITIAFWYKSLENNILQYLIMKDKSSDASYYVQINNSATIKFCTTGGTCASMSNSGFLNNWVHIVITFDGTTAKFYKNGSYISQQGTMNAIDYTSPLKLYLGYSSNAPQGLMDDVRIYNRVLSSNEVLQLYNSSQSKISLPVSKPVDANLNSGLVGYWTFDGKNLINNVLDSSGQGRTGYLKNFTSTSSAIVPGKVGQALGFDGIDDYIDAGAVDWLGTGALTISAWIYPRSHGEGGNGSIIDNRKVVFGMYDTAGANTIVFSSDADATYAKSANSSVPFNKWTHVIATRDASGVANLYVNGVLSGTANQNSGTPVAGSIGVQIGNTIITSRTWDGYIDDLKVYNRVLSVGEIYQLYNQGVAKIASTESTLLYTFKSSI